MNIAILSHLKYPIAEPFAGGLEMHTHLLARLLAERGYAVTLFAAEGSDTRLMRGPICLPTGEARDDEDAARIEVDEFLAYTVMMDRVAKGDFDLVHNNSLHDLPLRRSRDLGIPMVTVLHTPPFESLSAGVRQAGRDVVFAAVSASLAVDWADLRPRPRVIGNGIDLAAFPFQRHRETQPHAFWSGRIVPEKGLHLAIDAVRLAGLPLTFAGPRNDAAYWSREIAPRLGPDLTDLGHLPHRELAAAMGRASVALVTPRWAEPFGLVTAEALACGTPVAAFARGALPDILDKTCGRLARPDDVADLALAIRTATHLDRRACRARAEVMFDAEVMTDLYEALYRDVLAAQESTVRRVPRDMLLDETEA